MRSDSEQSFSEFILELNKEHGLGQLPLVKKGVSDLYFARAFFVETIKVLAPEVIEALHEQCFVEFSQASPTYSAWYKKRYSHATETYLATPECCHWENLLEASQDEESLKPLIQSLKVWSEQYNLKDTWLIDEATVTLSAWLHSPKLARTKTWHYPGTQYYKGENLYTEAWLFNYPEYSAQVKPQELYEKDDDPLLKQVMTIWWENQPSRYDPPLPMLPPFEPQVETREDYKRKIEPIIDAYIERSLERAEQEGFKPPPKKRKLEEHCEWLVRYQIQGWTHSQIADEYYENTERALGEDTIGKAVRNTAHLVKITLREPDPGGRPKTKS